MRPLLYISQRNVYICSKAIYVISKYLCVYTYAKGGDAGNADMPLLESDNIERLELEVLNEDGTLVDISKSSREVISNVESEYGSKIGMMNDLSSSRDSSGRGGDDLFLHSQAEKRVGFQGGMDSWKGCVLVAPRNLDRGFPPFIATIIRSGLSFFSEDELDLKGRELLSTHDDEDDDEDSQDEGDGSNVGGGDIELRGLYRRSGSGYTKVGGSSLEEDNDYADDDDEFQL